jgi:hypothetical protein
MVRWAVFNDKVDPPVDGAGNYLWFPPDVERLREVLLETSFRPAPGRASRWRSKTSPSTA